MDRAKKSSALHMPPTGTTVAGQSKPSFFNCFIGEAQSTRKSVVQTNMLGNNSFCLKGGCSGTVQVLEMDRCLTAPCLAFPIYSLETRRLVKCNKCFYVSSLQAHLLNSRGSNGLEKKLPVKFSLTPTRGGGRGGDSTQAVRPHHRSLGKMTHQTDNGSSSTSGFSQKEPGAADKFRTFSFERSSTAEPLPMHKESLLVTIPEPQGPTIPKYAQHLPPLDRPLKAAEKEKDEGAGETRKPTIKDEMKVGDPSFTLSSQRDIDARRPRDGVMLKIHTDDAECCNKEVTSCHQNNTKYNRVQSYELRQEPPKRQQCGQGEDALRQDEGQSYVDDEQTRLIGFLISRIEKSGSTEDDALYLGRLIQRLKAKGGLNKLLERITGSEALGTSERQDDNDKVAPLGVQGGGNKRTELPQWLFVKEGDSADISALPCMKKKALNGTERKYVGPPISPSTRNISTFAPVGGKFLVDPPMSHISFARKKGMQKGSDSPKLPFSPGPQLRERNLHWQTDASQRMGQSWVSWRQCSKGDPSEIIQPSFSQEETSQIFHNINTGQEMSQNPSQPLLLISSAPSDLVNYIARATKTDMKTRDPSPRCADRQKEDERVKEEAAYSYSGWGTWKSSPCKASDPPTNDPPRQPQGRKVKYLEPRGRRKISCPSQSSRLTNVGRKNKSREDIGEARKDKNETVDFVLSSDGLQQDAPVLDCQTPKLPQPPPHNRMQQPKGKSERSPALRLGVDVSRSESPCVALVGNDPYRDHYPTSPMVTNAKSRNRQQHRHSTVQDNPVRATTPSKARARQMLSRQRSKLRETSSSMPCDVPGGAPMQTRYLVTPLSMPAVETGLTERSLARANFPSNDQLDKNVDDIIKETVMAMKSSITCSTVAPVMPDLPLL